MNAPESQQRQEKHELSLQQDQNHQPQHLPPQQQFSDLPQQNVQLPQQHQQQQGIDDMIWDGKVIENKFFVNHLKFLKFLRTAHQH